MLAMTAVIDYTFKMCF